MMMPCKKRGDGIPPMCIAAKAMNEQQDWFVAVLWVPVQIMKPVAVGFQKAGFGWLIQCFLKPAWIFCWCRFIHIAVVFSHRKSLSGAACKLLGNIDQGVT